MELNHKSFDTISEGTKVLDKLRVKYPELKRLDELVDSYDALFNPEQLVNYISELSLCLIHISDVCSAFVSKANESYTFRKFAVLWSFNSLKQKLSIKERENIALDNTFEFYKDELLNRYLSDYLKSKLETTQNFVSSLQTKARFLRNERFNSNNQT